jgi:hypothetical protein
MPDARDRGAMMRWVWRGTALVALLIGWVFIAWQNHFHITAPLVFVCLGYLAVVATVYNLWRTGAAAVASAEDEGDSTWAKPAGVRGELEREKRTLLKAIKEAEFDHQMGKLSQRDADEMIRTYRARAIEVLKDLERLDLGSAGSAREQILRHVRARIEIEARSHKKAAGPKQGAKLGGSKVEGAKGQDRQDHQDHQDHQDQTTNPLARSGATPAEPATTAAGATFMASPAPDGAAPQATEVAEAADAAEAAIAPPYDDQAAPRADIDDEAMNADSTTAVEPMRGTAAKEATP